eukprot:11293688-Ditylum_brightwellii.AAC.1
MLHLLYSQWCGTPLNYPLVLGLPATDAPILQVLHATTPLPLHSQTFSNRAPNSASAADAM